MYQFCHVIENYEGVTDNEKAKIPDRYYKNTKAYLVITKCNCGETATKEEIDSKNIIEVFARNLE